MLLVPAAVVTLISTVPVPAGAVAVICVALLTVKPVALALPNVTAVVPAKLRPVMVTEVPPNTGPAVGLIDVISGAAFGVMVLDACDALLEPSALVAKTVKV